MNTPENEFVREPSREQNDVTSQKYLQALEGSTPESSSTVQQPVQIEVQDEHLVDAPKKSSLWSVVASVPKRWWRNKAWRYGVPAVLLLAGAAAFLVPTVRYSVLNVAGVRVPLSTTIVDSQTSLPLENMLVSVQGQEARTDVDGRVAFEDLRLGASTLTVDKTGYAPYQNELVLGWGSNPLKNQPIVATGTQFSFVVTDWLSGEAVKGVSVSSGDNSATSDEEGRVLLTVGELNDMTQASVSASGYRDEVVTLENAVEDEPVQLVSSQKHTFVSNRDGAYDLYKTDLDGQNEQVLLSATGKEREIPHAVAHSSGDYIAYISTRDGEANSGGFIYDGLFIVTVANGEFERVTRSEQVQVIGWSGDRLIYTAITEGVSGNNPGRSKLLSYDIFSGERVELARSNYFNDVQLIRNRIYYSVSSFAVPIDEAKLFAVDADGQNRSTVIDSQVWSIVHAGYDMIHFQAVNEQLKTVWYTQQAGQEPEPLTAPPVVQLSRTYVESPDSTRALRVETRDGKGVLLSYDIEAATESTLHTAPGLTYPAYWLTNDVVVYRVVNSQESADYVLDVRSGEPRKIADVIGNESRNFY